MTVGNGLSLELYFLIVGANMLIDIGCFKYRFSKIGWGIIFPLAILANICAWGFFNWRLMTASQSTVGPWYPSLLIKFIIYGWPLSHLYPKIDFKKLYSTIGGITVLGGVIAAVLIKRVFGLNF